jgi:hypothetical protein
MISRKKGKPHSRGEKYVVAKIGEMSEERQTSAQLKNKTPSGTVTRGRRNRRIAREKTKLDAHELMRKIAPEEARDLARP